MLYQYYQYNKVKKHTARAKRRGIANEIHLQREIRRIFGNVTQNN